MDASISVGDRVRFFRDGRGLTQLQVATRSGLSVDTVGSIERGVRIPTLHTLHLLAQVLGVSINALRGEPRVEPGGVGHPRLPAVYDALLGIGVRTRDVGLDAMETRVEALGATWMTSRRDNYERTAGLLPGILRDVESMRRFHRGAAAPERRRVARLAAQTCFVTRRFAKSVSRSEVGILAADRCVQAAEDADDPFLLAAARWHLGGQLLHDGQLDGAHEVTRVTIEDLERVMGDDRGGLSMRAVPVARATGVTNAYWTVWGPTNVDLYSVAVEAEGSKPHDGLRAARSIRHEDVMALPSIDRQARHLMHVAWLHDQLDEDAGVVVHLEQAQELGPQEIRYNVLAHQMVRRLLTRASSSYRTRVVGLAERLGMLQ